MDNPYALEKFRQAERALCEGLGDIKERLKEAYMCFHPVRKEDFPDDLRSDYQWVIDQLTRKPPLVAKIGGAVVSGSVDQTLHLMRRKTAAKIAERIRHICKRLCEYNDRQHDEN